MLAAMADCTTDLSGFTMSPTTGRLMATVARNTVTGQDAGGWCPLAHAPMHICRVDMLGIQAAASCNQFRRLFRKCRCERF